MIYLLTVLILNGLSPVHAAPSQEGVRFGLEILLNEARLAIRNRGAHQAELDRMKTRAEFLKMHERIPLAENLPGLTQRLAETAASRNLTLVGWKVTRRQSCNRPVPVRVYSDLPRFDLTDEQVAQEIDLDLRISGELMNVEQWVADWRRSVPRLVESLGGIRKLSDRLWEVRLRTYRFRPISFPMIVIREPPLPAPLRKRFSRELAEIRRLGASARPELDLLGRVLLERARYRYFAKVSDPN